jgi:hypothetical protein
MAGRAGVRRTSRGRYYGTALVAGKEDFRAVRAGGIRGWVVARLPVSGRDRPGAGGHRPARNSFILRRRGTCFCAANLAARSRCIPGAWAWIGALVQRTRTRPNQRSTTCRDLDAHDGQQRSRNSTVAHCFFWSGVRKCHCCAFSCPHFPSDSYGRASPLRCI